MFSTIAVICCVVLSIIWYFRHRKRLEVANRLQGPKAFPIIGRYEIFTVPPDEILSHLTALSTDFKGYYKIWVGQAFWVVVYDPKIIEIMLTDQTLLKAKNYQYLRPWLGNGLITNEGKPWFNKRKAITPAFHFNILEDFIDIFIRQADILIDKLDLCAIVDVVPILKLFTFDVICESAMGIDMKAQHNADHEYIKATQKIVTVGYSRMLNPFFANDVIFKLSKYYKPFHKSLKVIHNVNHAVIINRRKELEKENENEQEVTVDEFGRKKKLALLNMLLKARIDGQPLSDKEIEDEVSTFMFAGHDTTGTALSFLLYSLAKHPDVQKKVAEEVFSVFGEKGSYDITMKALNQLKYLDLVMKESMRMYTTVPFIGRHILEEYKIDDIVFPSNTNISIFVYGMCHNEDLFPEPEKFNPARFDVTTSTDKHHPFTFIPFSAGHRNCIGQKFAIFEMKTAVTKLLQNYQIELADPDEKLIILEGLVLKSKNGIRLKFTRR